MLVRLGGIFEREEPVCADGLAGVPLFGRAPDEIGQPALPARAVLGRDAPVLLLLGVALGRATDDCRVPDERAV